jgi:hypothetical protein
MKIHFIGQQKQPIARLASWAGVAGVFGLGFLPCPGCGAPMLWHLWPVAGVLALHTLHVERKKKQGQCEDFIHIETSKDSK